MRTPKLYGQGQIGMAEFKPVNSEDRLIYELMPMLIGIGPNEDLHCYGSCFVCWPHMAITARHVVEELYRRDPGIPLGKPAKFNYWVVQITWDGDLPRYIVWTIDTIATSRPSDVAIIWLKALDENAAQYKQWKVAPMTFDPPPIGAPIKAFGLHNVRFDGSRVNAEGKFEHIAMQSDRSVATGNVKQHHWGGRDKGLYNFPCFEVDARFEHGMSGGLVINERSEVCGIVCGSLPATSEGEEHVSYVTMLWPMMGLPIPSSLVPSGVESARYRLLDLSVRGIFTPYGWERVLIEEEPEGSGGPTMRYLRKQ